MKSTVSITSKLETEQSRFRPLNKTSTMFYLPTATFPLYPHMPHFGASFASPEMYPVHRDKDIRVQSAHMSQCYHPVFQGMPYHRTIEEKPTQSYIGLIGKAILSSPQQKLILSDIYNYILSHYPYFRTKGPGWRNSIRHNLSLNDCFVKVGRSPNGKGHFWAINPINYDDFSRGDYKRKRMPRRTAAGDGAKEKMLGKMDEVKTNKGIRKGLSQEMTSKIVRMTSNSAKWGFDIDTILSKKAASASVVS